MNILFMCVANSARSQIAEGIARNYFGGLHQIASAGSNPSQVNPMAVAVLQEVNIATTSLFSKSVADLPQPFVQDLHFVITLCAEEVCPVVISTAKKIHWPIKDPAGQDGSEEIQINRFRKVRDALIARMQELESILNSERGK